MPLNAVARSAIEELRRVHGVTNLTPDEVVELNDLGASQLAAAKSEDGDVTSPPVRVGNVLLHPMTCAAADFIERWSSFPLPRRTRMLLVPFAMARGREPDALVGITTKRELGSAVAAWARTASAAYEELDAAATRLMSSGDDEEAPDVREMVLFVCSWIGSWDAGLADSIRELCLARLGADRIHKETDDPDRAMYWRKLSVRLGAITGVSPDFWYAEDRVLALHAYKAALRRDTMRAGGGGSSSESRVVRRLSELRAAMKRIVELRKGAGGKEAAK